MCNHTKRFIYFNPRAPRGARHRRIHMAQVVEAFQSTRPARGATGERRHHHSGRQYISIHAPREGRDRSRASAAGRQEHFNPRAPRGARPPCEFLRQKFFQFQSTRPARGATTLNLPMAQRFSNFNPRAPRGARLVNNALAYRRVDFNPRAPRGARPLSHHQRCERVEFQSTRPARGATIDKVKCPKTAEISIHAPREGRDKEGRTVTVPYCKFQSTRPARGATGL